MPLTHIGNGLIWIGHVRLDGAEDLAESALSFAVCHNELVASDVGGLTGLDWGHLYGRHVIVAVALLHRVGGDCLQQFGVELTAERLPAEVEIGESDPADFL